MIKVFTICFKSDMYYLLKIYIYCLYLLKYFLVLCIEYLYNMTKYIHRRFILVLLKGGHSETTGKGLAICSSL